MVEEARWLDIMGNTDSVHDVEMNSLSNADNDRPYIKVIILWFTNFLSLLHSAVLLLLIEWNDRAGYIFYKCINGVDNVPISSKRWYKYVVFQFEQLKFLNWENKERSKMEQQEFSCSFITKEHYWQIEQVVDHEAILMSSLARELVKQKCKYMQLHLQISWRTDTTRCTIYVEQGLFLNCVNNISIFHISYFFFF